ncbi:MAG: hypothetical protein PHR68_02485, partial [Candidatus Gracilibacteria bacterium]|nr:hypothetical protein [Candidatus Gracilibacteria bacterium]
RNISKKIKIQDKEIIFKKVQNKNANLYSKFSKYTNKINVFGTEFKISNMELSLLETSLVSDNIEGVDINLISKVIKKYAKVLKYEYFYEIGVLKYIMAFNRLKEIGKNIDKKFYETMLDIIKKNGGLFIGEGLRKI